MGSNGVTVPRLKGERTFEVEVWTFDRRWRRLRTPRSLLLPEQRPGRTHPRPRAAGASHDCPASKHAQHHGKSLQGGGGKRRDTAPAPEGADDIRSRAPSLPACHNSPLKEKRPMNHHHCEPSGNNTRTLYALDLPRAPVRHRLSGAAPRALRRLRDHGLQFRP